MDTTTHVSGRYLFTLTDTTVAVTVNGNPIDVFFIDPAERADWLTFVDAWIEQWSLDVQRG